jgi:hypothetical protein
LNDYDLSVILDETMQNTGMTSEYRTGKAPFMARELLMDLPRPAAGEESIELTHVYAYELESWMYIILFILLGYRFEPSPEKDILRGW